MRLSLNANAVAQTPSTLSNTGGMSVVSFFFLLYLLQHMCDRHSHMDRHKSLLDCIRWDASHASYPSSSLRFDHFYLNLG